MTRQTVVSQIVDTETDEIVPSNQPARGGPNFRR